MQIELIKQKIKKDNYTNNSYKFKPLKWCCEKLKDNPLIDLVYEYTEDDSCYCDELLPSIAIRRTEIIYDYDDEWEQDTYYKINYCPFCGEIIKISIVREEDVTDILNELESQREKTWKKYNKTDSKKKSEELRKVVNILDNKINYFYSLNEYINLEEIIK